MLPPTVSVKHRVVKLQSSLRKREMATEEKIQKIEPNGEGDCSLREYQPEQDRPADTFVNAWWGFVLDSCLTPEERHGATNLNK